jgi:hypothetical protein
MRKTLTVLFGSLMLSTFLLIDVVGQSATNLNGTWIWTSRPNKKHEQTQFSLDIKQRAGKVSGQIWFGMLVDGENDGADSSSIPFVGTIKGTRVTIEFDPTDIHSIDDEHVRYKRPRSPSTAFLDLKNGKLVWTQSNGALDDIGLGPLRSFTLSRYH